MKLFQELSRRIIRNSATHPSCMHLCMREMLAFANFSAVALVHFKCLFSSTLVRDSQTSFEKETRKKRAQPSGWLLFPTSSISAFLLDPLAYDPSSCKPL